MSASAKTQAEPSTRRRQHRRREIAGIVLLALGLFSGLALASMQAGEGTMMGPGGAAAAGGLYALTGFTSYLFIAGMLVASVRCFRGKRIVDSFGEGMGALLLAGAVAVLLHLPFAGEAVASHGPGGLLGEWLGEMCAAVIGTVGAALGGTAMLVVALLLLTDVTMGQVTTALGWAAGHARRGIVTGALAAWRVARAAFP